MARPLKVLSNTDLKEMSNGELDICADLILKEFIDNSGVGHLTINDGAGGTTIGTFTDTIRTDAVGTHPTAGSTNSTAYVFRQDLSSVSPNPSARPLQSHVSDSGDVQEMTDAQITSDIINKVNDKIALFSIGTYKLQPSAPSGGTWTSVGTITNTVIGASDETSTLWKRTDTPSATVVRPIKVDSGTFKEMTDAEIEYMAIHFRASIVATSVGKYELAASTPSPGTWIQCGAGFSDTRREVSDSSYSGDYTGNYDTTYTGTYTGGYTATYTGAYTGNYDTTYTGVYTGNYTGVYTGVYSGNYTGVYTGNYIAYYSGVNYGTYSGDYTGVYTGNYTGNYTGVFAGDYTGNYTATYTGIYTGTYDNTYTGIYTGGYTSTYTGIYTGAYVGATVQSALETVSTMKLWLRTA